VLFVLVRHTWGLSGSPALILLGKDLRPIVNSMSAGVDLFFVLSGVLLSRHFIVSDRRGRPWPRLFPYLLARIGRIGPPYWVTLFLVLVLFTPAFIPEDRVFSANGLRVFVAHIFFAQTAYLPAFGAYPVETPFWTLTLEMCFYLILPVMAWFFLRRRWQLALPTTLLISLAYLWIVRNSADPVVNAWMSYTGRLGLPYDPQGVRFFLSHQFPAFLFHFGVGITVGVLMDVAATAKSGSRALSQRAGGAYALAGLFLLIFVMRRHGWSSLANGYANPLNYMKSSSGSALEYYYLEAIPYAVAFGLIILGVGLGPRWVRAALASPALRFWGIIGYSVYLLHMPLLWKLNSYGFVARVGQPLQHFWLLLGLATILVGTLSTGFFLAVERPSMRAAHRARAWAQSLSPSEPVRLSATGPVPIAVAGDPAEQPGDLVVQEQR
jgi:peptidoglycan/LPS O-acetylase OafA/YrhL